MAATNYTPIQLYYSTTASAVPLAANLAQGELAINITDGKLYYEDNAGVVQVIATKGAGTIGGSTTQIQYNNAGALAGSSAMTFNNGTNTVTLTTLNLTNALGATYGGTAQSSYTQGDLLYSSATNTLSKLGIGTVDYILTSTGSVPQWSAPSSISVLTATNLAGGAGGSVPYQSAASTTTFLAIGAANRVMTSTGSAPQWVTALTGLTGVSSSSITNTSLTSGRVVFSTTGGAQTDDADLTFNGTTLSAGGYSTSGLSTLVKTVTIGNSNFDGTAVFAAATPAKLYIGTGTVTDTTSAIGATNAVGAISSLAITPIAATNTSVTYTNAATLYIAGAPSAGTNVTLTNPYSLYVAAGDAYFGGTVTAATVNITTLDLTNLEVTNIKAKDGTASITLADSTGVASFTANPVLSGGTANGVLYLNGSKGATSGSAFTFDGANVLTLFRTTATEANEPTIKFSNLTFAGQNPGVVKSSNGGLALDIQSGSDSTFQLRSRIYVEGGSANTISFQASSNNGSTYDTRMALTNTGLGIGITPAAKLDVSNGASPASRLRVGVGAGAASTLYSTLAAGDYVSFETNGSEVARFTSARSLLIGATSAFNGELLQVSRAGSVSATDFIYSTAPTALIQTPNDGSDNTAVLMLRAAYTDGSVSAGSISVQSVAQYRAKMLLTYDADGSGGYFAINQFYPSSSTTYERGRFDYLGNFMIGTTSINTSTDVFTVAKTSNSVDVRMVIRQFGNNTAAALALIANDDNGAPYNNISSSTNGGTTHWKLGGVGGLTSGLAISTGGSERARYDSLGNYYVGATSGLAGPTSAGLYVQSGSYVAGGQVTQLLGYWMSTASDNNGVGGVGIQYYRVPRGGGIQTGTEIRFYTGYSYTPSTTAHVGTFDQNGNFSVLSGNISVGLGGSYNAVAVYIGTDTNGATAQGGVSIGGGATASIDLGHANGTASGVSYTRYIYNGGVIGSVTQNGVSQVLYNISSDYRLKNITGSLTGYKERLMSLLPKQGTWIADGSEFRGFLAHEFANPYRSSVTGEKDAVDADGNPIMQAMQASTSEVMADLVAMVKDLVTENESLKARLDAANL